MALENLLLRYSPPSRLDQAPMGTMVRVIINDYGDEDIYIQTSTKEELPNWQKLGVILEKALAKLSTDSSFINECLMLYLDPTKDHKISFMKISNILAKRSQID